MIAPASLRRMCAAMIARAVAFSPVIAGDSFPVVMSARKNTVSNVSADANPANIASPASSFIFFIVPPVLATLRRQIRHRAGLGRNRHYLQVAFTQNRKMMGEMARNYER